LIAAAVIVSILPAAERCGMRCEPLDPGPLRTAKAAGIDAVTENVAVTPAIRMQGRVHNEAGGGHG